jgi:ClpP class serine protease
MSLYYWLMSSEALQARAARELRGPILARSVASREAERPARLSVDNGVATITVEGVLTPTPDPMAAWDGEANTTYPELQDALAAAMADKKVAEIVWSINSPGGAVDGLFALLDDIEDAKAAGKPMRAVASNAHSAAYGIAAAVGHITATDRMASFGSVGFTTNSFVLGEMIGKVVHMTNTDAPEKCPAVGTPEGQRVAVRYLDQIGAEFMGAIARGRGVAPEAVAAGYGRGSSMLAGAAMAARMIDAVASRPSNARTHLDVRTHVCDAPASMATLPTPAPAAVPAVEAALDIPVVVDLDAFAAERAELAALRADKAKREGVELRGLVTDLVALNAETPATAWIDGAPAPRLAAEGLASLRARVDALRAVRSANPVASAPVAPPAVVASDDLTPIEAHQASQIKDAAHRDRFVARCLKSRAPKRK